MIKIILADDHNIVRNGIKALLEKESEFDIVGEAAEGQAVLNLLEQGISVDIILTDLTMQGMDGLELVDKLKNGYPHIKPIVLSAHDNEQYVAKAFTVGAVGYLLKSIRSDELIFALKHVAENHQYLSSELTTKFLSRMFSVTERAEPISWNGIEFTEKEIEVLALIGDGYTNQEIADRIYSGKRTVEGYRQSLIDKTGVRNTAALIRFAVVNGIIN